MNKVKKNVSMWHYSVYMSAVVLMLCGLTFLLASCMEEVVEKPYSGKKVNVHFSLVGVTDRGNEDITRSSGDDSGKDSETVVIPLMNDLCMYASLEADSDNKMRAATSNMDDGVQLRVVAYLNGTTYSAHIDYTVSKGLLTSPNTLEVNEGEYRFVAYSYNSTTILPLHDDYLISDIDPSTDLLWGCYPATGTHTITAFSYEEVPVTMSHLFSQMTILATTNELSKSIKINNINMVSITPGKKVNLNVKDGTLTSASDAPQQLSSKWLGLGTTTAISQPRTVYTNNMEDFQVHIGSLSLEGYSKPFTNLTLTFNKQLQSGVSYTMRLRFKKDESNIGMNDDAPANVNTYVGAFWKANQKGERLIRIDMGTANQGAWTAKVVWLDPRWGSGDGVALSTDRLDNASLLARGISFSSDMNPDSYGSPEDYPVTGYTTTLSGTVNSSNPFIFFRIGLRSHYKPTAAYPARYAVILLSYNNNTKQQRIFLRQGEDADYLMTNNDPVNSGGLSRRTQCVPFTTYNLTAKMLDEQVPLRGATFTDYPTQAGAMFQWACPYQHPTFGRQRWAWNPHVKNPAAQWVNIPTSDYWDKLMAEEEVCPPGYRRPNDGSISRNEPCTDISQSEFRQSLFLNPKTGFNFSNETTNSMWGYYADGFFDRRRIVDNKAVVPDSRSIAYIGRLFYNPTSGSDRYNASLFFPATGGRFPDNGILFSTGYEGMYWSSSANTDSHIYGLVLRVWDYHAFPWRSYKGMGLPIRAVVE